METKDDMPSSTTNIDKTESQDNDNVSAVELHDKKSQPIISILQDNIVIQQDIVMIHSSDYARKCNRLAKIRGRSTLLNGLLEAYGLLCQMRLISPEPCSKKDLKTFHSEDYIECLERVSSLEYDVEKYDDELEAYGLCYDCPAFPGVFDYAALVSGATLRAAEELNEARCRIAINWLGGWHHAKKDEADGYCYFNDIVLAILKLREKFERVLYIDLDLHHGDGVENAFYATAKVLTWSIHKLSPGFFPGTGKLSDVGYGRGRFYTLNTPLKDGVDDKTFYRVFQRIACKIREQYDPKVIVVQTGVDALATDPCNSFNLTHEVYGQCLKLVLDWKLPTLILGGGGYNLADSAKCWTYLTSVILGLELSDEIPEHDYLLKYGPDYSLSVSAGNRSNENTENMIESLLDETLEILDEIHVS